ncbi:hypothetical protein BT96DRAFT_951877 [Gymnopus androsaceus JB14]|uniref:Uncharacterized protein n=1 Tax=Gymnopus androsaceus JB14 TaxID=1447944 RepID=A0A6A4GBC6_9AGAR|nr:hypothetical protein BT96DRAFT_951877 [Gymnopus androsaceus JB14]
MVQLTPWVLCMSLVLLGPEAPLVRSDLAHELETFEATEAQNAAASKARFFKDQEDACLAAVETKRCLELEQQRKGKRAVKAHFEEDMWEQEWNEKRACYDDSNGDGDVPRSATASQEASPSTPSCTSSVIYIASDEDSEKSKEEKIKRMRERIAKQKSPVYAFFHRDPQYPLR